VYGSSWGFVPGSQVVQSQVERNFQVQLNELIWSCNVLPIFADKASVDDMLSKLSTTHGIQSILEEMSFLSL
jgi:hypothetical protein